MPRFVVLDSFKHVLNALDGVLPVGLAKAVVASACYRGPLMHVARTPGSVKRGWIVSALALVSYAVFGLSLFYDDSIDSLPWTVMSCLLGAALSLVALVFGVVAMSTRPTETKRSWLAPLILIVLGVAGMAVPVAVMLAIGAGLARS